MAHEPAPYPDARALLRKYGLRAKKTWGQNFLVDERAYREIVAATGAGPEDTVIEIGAGLGTLTARLSLVARRVIAIERDREMVAILRAELLGNERVVIAEENALTFDYTADPDDVFPPLATAVIDGSVTVTGGAVAEKRARRPAILVGNLPYQIASPLLFRFLDARAALRRMVVMLQLEMAQRIIAAPDTSEYGALSVMVQMVAEPKIVARVSAGCFHPAPRVASAVVRLEPLAGTRAAVLDEGWFSKVVHAAFNQRRKTLRNALRARLDADDVERGLGDAAIDGQRRGETLSVEEFARLSDALLRAQAGRLPPP